MSNNQQEQYNSIFRDDRLIDFLNFDFDNEIELDSLINPRLESPPFSTIQMRNYFDPAEQNIPFNSLQTINTTQQPVFQPQQPRPFVFPATNIFRSELICKKIKIRKNQKIQSKKIKQPVECPICLLDIKKNCLILDIECKHQFHKKCLQRWMKKQQNCPLCRMDICCQDDC